MDLVNTPMAAATNTMGNRRIRPPANKTHPIKAGRAMRNRSEAKSFAAHQVSLSARPRNFMDSHTNSAITNSSNMILSSCKIVGWQKGLVLLPSA